MEKKWEDMSAEERREARFETWLSAEGVEFQSPEAEATYKEAIMRFKDAVLMEKVPDRVPIFMFGTFMQPDIYGITPYESMYDTKKLISAHRKFLVDFKPDYYLPPIFGGLGKVFEILDYKQYKWPGHGVSKESVYQTLEGEYMLPEDYEALIEDPTNFWLRTYLPRICGALEPLKDIGAFTDIWELPFISTSMVPFGIPDVQNAFKALLEAGNEAMAWIEEIGAFELEARGMGIPCVVAGASKAPFDILGDTLRGTRAMAIDMYRRPEMILKAVEKITPIYVKQGVNSANFQGNPIVFIPLHKGADGFMSDAAVREILLAHL